MTEKKLENLFEQREKLTLRRIHARHEALKDVAGFKCETEEHRKARMALFFNIDNYSRAAKVADDILEKPSKEMRAYQNEKRELAKRCGGIERQMPNGQVGISDVTDHQKYNEGVAKLEMQYKATLKEDTERIDRNTELLDMEVSKVPDPHYADPSWFPDTVGPDKLAEISFMLKDMSEDDEEPKADKKKGKK